MRAAIPVFLCIFATGIRAADDHPTLGLVYNTKEWSSLSYDCDLKSAEVLDCDFTQVSLRKKSTAKSIEEKIVAASKEKIEVPSADICENVAKYIAAIEGRATMPKEFQRPKSDLEGADMLKLMRAFNSHCQKPTVETQAAFARAASEPETRTCSVSTNHFRQSFQLLVDSNSKRKTWVVRSVPTGECGVVRLDRFEGESPEWAEKLKVWRYVARKAITNPQGKDLIKCSDLDEATYTYTWDTEFAKRAAKCDYIEFSVF